MLLDLVIMRRVFDHLFNYLYDAGDGSAAGWVSRVEQRDCVCEGTESACYITEWFEPASCPPATDTVRSQRTG